MDGRTISHFRILEKIGEGGMGLVYKAEDERLRRQVALKLLPPDLVGNADSRRRFVREAQAAAAVAHPAIAAVYEAGEDGDDVYIAMELIEGQTLQTMIEAGPIPVAEAVRITTEIARGLERAHGLGIVHRDLKPANIIVAADGHVKILDFGLAKLRARVSGEFRAVTPFDDEQTQEGALIGTTAYMSPEQARSITVGSRSDIFSLGIVLYEMLTATHPFRGNTGIDTLSAILKDTPLPPSRINPDVGAALDGLIARMLKKDADERPAARMLIEELSSVLAAPAPAERTRGSIAVLPFADMSPGRDQDYLCEGIAEELIHALSRVEGLRVAARTSAFRFKGRDDDVRRIGHQLGVAAVLEGSVRKAGDHLRVTVDLVDAVDGYHLWSERYDRDAEGVFAIEEEIAAAVVDTLKIRLASAPTVARATDDVEAHNLYLQGRYWWNKRHQGGLWKSVEFFEQAIARDAGYALAHAGFADAYSVMGMYCFLPPRTAFTRAREAAERAASIDDTLAAAHVSRALVHFWFDFDFDAAEREFRRAIELDPQHVPAYIFLGQMLPIVGRVADAPPVWAKALELDPLSSLTHGIVGSALYFAHQHEAAVDPLSRSLEIEPIQVTALFIAALNYASLGRADEAVAAATRAAELAGRAPFFVGILGLVLGTVGRPDDARAVLAELLDRAEREYVAPLFIAWLHIGLRERDAALDWLERAFEDRDPLLFGLHTMPQFDILRDDPRCVELMRKMNLA